MRGLLLLITAGMMVGCGCGETGIEGQADSSSEPDVDLIVDTGFDLAPDSGIDIDTDDLSDTATDSPPSDCSLDEDIEIDATQWILRIGGSENEIPSHVTSSHEGHLLLSGTHRELSGDSSFTWITETDGEGTVITQQVIRDVVGWSPAVHSFSPTSIVQLRDCNRLIVGATTAYGSGGMDVWLAKLDMSGRILWQQAIGGPGHERNPAAIETRDGGYLVASMTDSFTVDDDWDLRLVRLETDGTISWQKRFGGEEDEWFKGPGRLVESNVGTSFVVVETTSFTDNSDAWLLELDPSGNLIRQVVLAGGSRYEQISVHEILVEGFDLVLAGSIHDIATGRGLAWLAKLAPSGELTWQKAYQADRPSYLGAAFPRGDGTFIVTGLLQFETPGRRRNNAWLASINDGGDIVWQLFISDGVDDWGTYSLVIPHQNGIVIATGAETINPDIHNPWDVVLARLGDDGSLSGDCSLLREAPALSQDTSVMTVETAVDPIDTYGTASEAYAAFIDVEIPVSMLCPE